MTTATLSSAARSVTYPPDFRSVADAEFLRLLQRAHALTNFDLNNSWLVYYTLKDLTPPAFTQLPTDNYPHIDRTLRQFLRSEPVRDTLLNHFLGLANVSHTAHLGFYRTASTLLDTDEVEPLQCQQIIDLYAAFKTALEPAYRKQLVDYWTYAEHGISRRELFIAEHKKALLLESAVGVEQGLLTTSQHSMLKEALEQYRKADKSMLQKHGVFHLALVGGQTLAEILPGAFVLTHTQTLEPSTLNESGLGEVLLHTELHGLEGFENLATMFQSLGVRFNDATQKQMLLRNLSQGQQQRVLDHSAVAISWRLSVMSGNVLQTLFEQQATRQQDDFSHLLRQARASQTPADEFLHNVPKHLATAAHLNNARMLDRNDSQLIGSSMPHWWWKVEHEQQQRWVQAARSYGDAIIKLHQLSTARPGSPQAVTAHDTRWREQATRLLQAELLMGQVQAHADQLPANAIAWIKAVIDNPSARLRQKVDGKTISVEFMTLKQHTLADVMRIAPQGAGANQPLLICTLNAPDSRVFRWYPDEETMREQILESVPFSRYLLRQLPEKSRPVECSAEQYELWLKHFRAEDIFSHLPLPIALPNFSFGRPSFVGQGQDYLLTRHSLKQSRSIALLATATASKNKRSLLETIGLNIAMLFIPPPVLIAMAAGATLFKAWEGFRHISEGDYKGAAHEFLGAIGYLGAAVFGKWLIDRVPFTALESVHPAPPLVSRIGANGEEHIGYLMSHESAPRLPDLEAVVPYDAEQFHSITLNDQQFFVKRQPNLFGHCQLYQVDPQNPDLLVSEGEYAVRGSLGLWRKTPYLRTSLSDLMLKQADLELGNLTRNWPGAIEQVSPAAKSVFEKNYLLLANTSNAEGFSEITDYCEGGSAAINSLLRTGVRSQKTQRFLTQFYRLNEYRGNAFRAAMVSPAGLQRLTREMGQVFVDNGIQSASISRWSAEQWSKDAFITSHGAQENTSIFLIFDTSISKKNLFTSFLGDHVAIAPSTPLQLVASRLVGERFYVYFKRPQILPHKLIDLYSGNSELLL